MRVVNIIGFRRGYNFLNELLALAKPFGRVVRHLVLDLRPKVDRILQNHVSQQAFLLCAFIVKGSVINQICNDRLLSSTRPTCSSRQKKKLGRWPSSTTVT